MPQSINEKNAGNPVIPPTVAAFASDVVKIRVRLLRKQMTKTRLTKRVR